VPTRQQIVDSIAALARKLGRAPTLFEFITSLGISRHSVLRFFPKWNDAVRAAKLRTTPLFVEFKSEELLKDWGETVRAQQRVPSRRAYLLAGKYEPRTLEKRFGSWTSMPRAFRKFAKGKRKWADVVSLLNQEPVSKQAQPSPAKLGYTRSKNRCVYGNPLDFPNFRHEPINEQGVVLLFGMLAADLGFIVESVQNGFPDCEAKRRIGPSRWQRVLIEFEFESRNFRDHHHPATGCDLIVCWRHNWPDCPSHLQVLELSSIIKSLGS